MEEEARGKQGDDPTQQIHTDISVTADRQDGESNTNDQDDNMNIDSFNLVKGDVKDNRSSQKVTEETSIIADNINTSDSNLETNNKEGTSVSDLEVGSYTHNSMLQTAVNVYSKKTAKKSKKSAKIKDKLNGSNDQDSELKSQDSRGNTSARRDEMNSTADNDSELMNEDSNDFEDTHQACWSTSWSGSGIWEHTENRRWIAVQKHMLPGRKRSISESSLIRDLGTGQFVDRFDLAPSDQSETSTDQFRIVTSRESMIRLNADMPDSQVPGPSSSSSQPDQSDNSVGGPSLRSSATPVGGSSLRSLDNPVAGPSSAPQSGEADDNPGVEHENTTRSDDVLHRETLRRERNKRKQRKQRLAKKRRKRSYMRPRHFSHSQQPPRQRSEGFNTTPRQKIMLTRSADSSPGRGSPSPDSLSRICLYWEKRLASPEYVILSDPESEP